MTRALRYNEFASRREVDMTTQEFNAQLRNFFRRELLGRQSMPQEETRKLLAQLIKEMADGQ